MNQYQKKTLERLSELYKDKDIHDIVYSVTFHEKPDSIIDLLINISVYNIHLSFLIIFQKTY